MKLKKHTSDTSKSAVYVQLTIESDNQLKMDSYEKLKSKITKTPTKIKKEKFRTKWKNKKL